MADGNGGLARVATVRRRLADQGPVLFVLAGDVLSPSLLSKYYSGRQMVEAFNAAKLDYATFGNHEFELPLDTLEARIAESELQVDLDQLRPGRRHARSPRCCPGTPSGSRATRSASSASPSRAATARRTAAPTPTARPIGRSTPWWRRAPSWSSASPTRPSRPTATCSPREPRLDLILGGHEHEAHDSIVSGRHVVKADANSRTAQFVTLWGGKGEWRQAVGLVKIDNRLPDDTAVAAVADRWDDSLRARLGPSAWSGAPPCRSTRATRSAGGRSPCWATWSPTRCAAGTGTDVALLNAGTLRLDDVIRPGPISNYQLESIFLFPDETRVLTVPLTGARLRDAPGARRRRRLAGQGRVPAGLRGVVHLRSRRHPRAAGSRATCAGRQAGRSGAGDTVRVAIPVYPACEGGDGYDVPGGGPACAARASAPRAADLLTKYVTDSLGGQVAAPPAGRIVRAGNTNPG